MFNKIVGIIEVKQNNKLMGSLNVENYLLLINTANSIYKLKEILRNTKDDVMHMPATLLILSWITQESMRPDYISKEQAKECLEILFENKFRSYIWLSY